MVISAGCALIKMTLVTFTVAKISFVGLLQFLAAGYALGLNRVRLSTDGLSPQKKTGVMRNEIGSRHRVIHNELVSSSCKGTRNGVTCEPLMGNSTKAESSPIIREHLVGYSTSIQASLAVTREPSKLVLVVEDEEPIQEFVKLTLERKGYRVLKANNGEEALVLYQQYRNAIELILMDILMPVMDGEAVIHVLKAIKSKVKIICASSLDLQRNLKGDTGVESLYFLPKPYSTNSLLQIVQAVLVADE